jgi:hypothetical protein
VIDDKSAFHTPTAPTPERVYNRTSAGLGTAPTWLVPKKGGGGGSVGPPGPPGPPGSGGDLTYVHTQGSLSASWAVAHGLGKYPSVEVVDTGNSVIIPDVHYVDANNLTLNFGSSISGKAYLN